MREIEREYQNEINENWEANRKSALAVKDYLEHSSVAYHGRCVHTLHIPKVYSAKEIDFFRQVVQTTYGIFEKIIREYLTSEAYRRCFPFSETLEKLILIPSLYDSLLPIARFDIFFSEDDFSFKFCEINTDGTSAMNEDRELNLAITHNLAHQKLCQRHSYGQFELFDTWVEAFGRIYASYEKKKASPYVAIVDFMEDASTTEFDEFKLRFEAHGYETEICEIRRLTYRDGVLYSPQGHPIDVIYRRAVTSDIMAHQEEVTAFLDALRDQAVCVIGSLCTQIIHNKWLFKVIREEETLRFLTPEEQAFVKEHIPETFLLRKGQFDLDRVLHEKERWIVKPLDSYASKGVYAGIDYNPGMWTELIESNMDQDYIVQEYYPPHTTQNIYFPDEQPQWKEYSNMAGLFVYDGAFAGVYSRLSDGGIISSQYNEKAVASLYLKDSEK